MDARSRSVQEWTVVSVVRFRDHDNSLGILVEHKACVLVAKVGGVRAVSFEQFELGVVAHNLRIDFFDLPLQLLILVAGVIAASLAGSVNRVECSVKLTVHLTDGCVEGVEDLSQVVPHENGLLLEGHSFNFSSASHSVLAAWFHKEQWVLLAVVVVLHTRSTKKGSRFDVTLCDATGHGAEKGIEHGADVFLNT